MKRKQYALVLPVLCGCLLALLPVVAFSQGDLTEKGEQIFNTRCITCHTIGGGRKIGPDLRGVTTRRPKDWLIAFISNPDKMFAKNDPTASKLLNEYKVRMPNLKLSSEDVDAIMAFLGSRQEAEEHAQRPITGPAGKPAAPPAPGSPQSGAALFAGSKRFSRGGPPCVSCHNVTGVNFIGGGNLGPDLTTAYSRFSEGMASVLTTITFPTMRPVFVNNPLAPQEVADLLAYFRETASRRQQDYTGTYLIVSAIGFAVIGIIGLIVWRNRLTGVRKALVERAGRETDRR